MEWFTDHDNVTDLARWLVAAHDYNACELLDYFAEPWKWSNEWADYQASKVPTGVEP